MDNKKINSFINYGFSSNNSVKTLFKMNFGISIFYVIGIIYGLILGSTERILSIVMISVMMIFSIFILSRIKKNSIANIIFVMALISLEATINFTIFALILCCILTRNTALYFLIALTPIITFFMYFALTINWLKKDVFSNKEKIKKDKIYLNSMIGGIAGLFIARIALFDISQTKALQIGIVLITFIAVCFSFGIINFLKYSYVKKLKF